jgi:pentalenic acid synthase
MTETVSPPEFPIVRTNPIVPPDEYFRIRSEGKPLIKVRLYDGSFAWLVTRYKDACQLLIDPRMSSDKQVPGFPAFRPAEKAPRPFHTLIEMDEPDHSRYRKMLIPSFTMQYAQQIRPEIQRIVDEALDEIVRKGPPVDLVRDFALPVPGAVISHLLGVAALDRPTFLEHAHRLASAHGEEEVQQVLRELMVFLNTVVTTLENEPTPGLLSRLSQEEVADGELTREYLIVIALFLLVAGHQTASTIISLGILALLEHPDQLALIREDPSLIPSAIHELTRFISPADLVVRRIALEDVEIGGEVIRAGEGILFPNALANRDAEVFPNPDELDISRDAKPNIAFGHGAHQCLGRNIAIMEMEVIISTLFERIPGLRLASPLDTLRAVDATGLVGVQELPVTW